MSDATHNHLRLRYHQMSFQHAGEPHGQVSLRANSGADRYPGGCLHVLFQRQRASRRLHGFVGDRGRARVQQRLGQRPVRGQVEVGEQHLPGTENPQRPIGKSPEGFV